MRIKIFALVICLVNVDCLANDTLVVKQELEPNIHQLKDAKLRECKHQADINQLFGDKRSVFIANCLKNNIKL